MNESRPGYPKTVVDLRSAPAPDAVMLRRWVVEDYTHLSPLRASLRDVVESQKISSGKRDDLAEKLTIAATELTSNALRHGRSSAVVMLSRSRTAFLIDVADEALADVPEIAQPQPGAVGGRGLHISHTLATGMGWYVADNRKHVWAEFRIPRRVPRLQAPRIPVPGLTELLRRLGH
jgi:serine/threonine-protein kinase RsbW